MKKLFFIVCLSIINISFSQTSQKETVLKQAYEMRQALMNKNYDVFSSYVHEGVIKMLGGKKKMIDISAAAIDKMSKEGYHFKKVDFSDASDIITVKNEQQAVVHQKIQMSTPKGNINADYYMIAVSGNNGKNWKFIDTSGKDIQTMRKYFPNLSSKLNIPKKKISK
ncbi:hypothetical protein [Chryseobacterium indologenes]|uniref:DUF4440 domain-containing protein n=1 Tax=Chryseobacterium indologenes TaxID=253 RepID=A0A0N0IX61_CHRID|nr:hypothetical protein [Chryseobacterium indologenes]KPE51991.1 hypothetical protein AOB46_07210 [Chryseobacterium indologenes]